MAGTLIATRYVPPGSFIGQLITPRPGQVSAEARLPCFIGRGSRLALGSNLPITRSFIFSQSLTFSSLAPFVANLTYPSDGDQQVARLFKADGTEVRRDQWSFQDSGTPGGQLDQVLINTEVYDVAATYFLDYQSTSRDVTDPVPIEELREIVTIGTRVDNPQFTEYQEFFITTGVTDPSPDSGNANPTSSLGTVTPGGGNTGTGDLDHATASAFSHNYTRQYSFEVTAQVVGVLATGTITVPAAGGSAIVDDTDQFVIDDGTNAAVTFAYDVGGGGTPVGTTPIVITGSETQTQLRDATVSAINGVTGLLITAAPGAGAGLVDLTADTYNSSNVTITESVADAGFLVSGMSGGVAREVTMEWDAAAVSPGNASAPNTPLHTSATKPSFTVTDDTAASFTPLLELGVRMEIDFGAAADNLFDVGDTYSFFAAGPGLFEADARYDNTNQFAVIETPVADAGNTGTTGSGLSVDATADFTGQYNADYTLEVTAVTGTTPGSRDATFVWGEAGDHVGINGTFVADEATPASLLQTLSKGVVLSVDFPVAVGNFAVGDKFTVQARAPRQFYQAKDNRTYTMTVSAATNPAAGEGFVQGTFVTDTPEGGFGTFQATGNDDPVTGPDFEDGHFVLSNNVLLAARNLFYPAMTSGNQHAASDVQTFAATQDGTIDWRLGAQVDETIEADQILTDVNGTVTGTPNTPYVILSQTPTAVNSVVTSVGSTPVTFTWLTGTPYITFVADPAEAIVVNYDWRSAEPDPGQTYFLTAKFLRSAELYNTPTLVLDRQDGRSLLAPASVDNHLYTMNEIAFDNGVAGAYYIQVQDPDDDGLYTDADFAEAITASEAPRRITDVVVLGQFGSLGSLLSSVTRMNDPFERRERLAWVGMPIGTPIGDATTPDTLVYTARNTLQVFGNSPAHGTRILVGSTEATRDIRLDDGTTVEVTMDGSFVAGALASLTASFQDPGLTMLRQTLAGFKTLETYGDVEDPRNLTLGGAQVIFLTDQGGGVFRVEEDETVDSFADDFKFINAMTQKQFVVRSVRSQVDASLIGVVVPSAQAGIGLVKGFVVGAVATLVSRGIVGRFQDDAGNERPINPDTDVVVFRDETDTTLYHVFFAYWLRTTVKRIFGLYSTNTSDFGLFRG